MSIATKNEAGSSRQADFGARRQAERRILHPCFAQALASEQSCSAEAIGAPRNNFG